MIRVCCRFVTKLNLVLQNKKMIALDTLYEDLICNYAL